MEEKEPMDYKKLFATCEYCGKEYKKKTTKQRFCSKICKNNAFGDYRRKHGYCHKEPLYAVWKSMKRRCTKKSDKSYKNYGLRGISVCEEWQNDYLRFREWAYANGYRDIKSKNGRNKLSIDRINNDGDYCPENCRWTTNKVQANNKQYNIPYDIKNQKCPICGKKFQIHEIPNMQKTCSRKCAIILRSKEYFEKTKDTFKKKCVVCGNIFEDRSGHFLRSKCCSRDCSNLLKSPIWEYKGKKLRVIEWSKIVNISAHALLHRKNELGWTIEETLSIPKGGKRIG